MFILLLRGGYRAMPRRKKMNFMETTASTLSVIGIYLMGIGDLSVCSQPNPPPLSSVLPRPRPTDRPTHPARHTTAINDPIKHATMFWSRCAAGRARRGDRVRSSLRRAGGLSGAAVCHTQSGENLFSFADAVSSSSPPPSFPPRCLSE